ncbi:MAG: NADH-quinone oxidoreductase subunit NuoI [Ignavibacteriales bacterium CG07_land_8_20_14_0_80_59_12]|jgi:NADH-quinone oxidoreductase subunit I|nr:MAG: NADH-quinone oxidoreductase subunit NuoI [Ignavibacteriales bacterium CG07_land_8_20_14_0_80_59_12]
MRERTTELKNGRTLPIRRKDLSVWQKAYIPEIVKGLTLTLRQMFRPKFTREYPEERWEPTGAFRGRPVLVSESGTERCVACGLCARVCPALAIFVQAEETSREKERRPKVFEIDMLRCIFCGFCEEVCPEEAIVMSKDFEVVFADRRKSIFEREKLLMPMEELMDRLDFLHRCR